MKQTGFRVRCIYKKDLALRLSLDCLATSYSTGRSVLKEADGQFRVPSALVTLNFCVWHRQIYQVKAYLPWKVGWERG
ncbi:hypothetical protein DXA39_02060 [Anaerococcus nagyae]|uniref:Uncharacterized protein n=1 Tax=Anaerococcus nagyae TaxID=1755241 RepID=A0A3E2TJ73_9FIRM|nr:hypothetical protein DXA39_02060 [Anaerococcus nagyae]